MRITLERINNQNSFELLFKPRNVVIFEATPKISFFIAGFIRQGFNLENLYLISFREKEIMGVKCFKSIDDVPVDKIDLLILSVRREILIQFLQEILSKKKVNYIHIFTAGTGESDERGIMIEREIKDILDSYENTRAIGPNCMGLYSPRGNIAYYSSFPLEMGNIGLIFQSGDLHSKMVKFGSRRYNLKFSIGISIGNCIDIQISELLQFFNNDKETDVICVYFEGFSVLHPQEGKKLLKVLKKMDKPVLFMRGGMTERGQKAVLTHTGSLATKQNIWEAIFKQCSIIEVSPSVDDLVDYVYLFSNYIQRFKNVNRKVIYPENKNALVILWSGGFGILATDSLTELGMELPYFEGETLQKLREIYPVKIGSLTNPFDLPWITHSKIFIDVSKAAIGKNINLVIVETDAWRDMEDAKFKGYYKNLLELKQHVESLDKVFIIILHHYPSESRNIFHKKLMNDNFLVYPSIDSAGKAFLALYNYGKKKIQLKLIENLQ